MRLSISRVDVPVTRRSREPTLLAIVSLSPSAERRDEPATSAPVPAYQVPPNGTLVTAPMTSSVWKVAVQPGDQVVVGQAMVIIEAMKTETAVLSPCNGAVLDVVVTPGMQVTSGAPLVVVAAV